MLKIYYLRISDFAGFPDDLLLATVGDATRIAVMDYKNERVRRTKLLGETMIRQLLRSVFGLKQENYALVKGEHGKPYLSGNASPVFFNLSHSGDYMVCALSENEVGVDIERDGRERLQVARRFFHPREVEALESLSGLQRKDLFFRYWSAKESFLKYTGNGLASPLSGFEVRFEENEIRIEKENIRVPVYVRECTIDRDYKCFVCSENPGWPEVRRFVFAGKSGKE